MYAVPAIVDPELPKSSIDYWCGQLLRTAKDYFGGAPSERAC